MTEEQIKDYTLRITQSNTTGLVVIIYELVLDSLREAQKAAKEQDYDAYRKHLKKAERYVGELIHGLNYEDPLARQVGDSYVKVHLNIVTARVKLDERLILDATAILEQMMPIFVRIAKEDQEPPMIANAQKVYAGLTYGRTSLNEMSVDLSQNRGYTV